VPGGRGYERHGRGGSLSFRQRKLLGNRGTARREKPHESASDPERIHDGSLVGKFTRRVGGGGTP